MHILVDVKCSEEIASPDCYQARNDAIGLFARNDEKEEVARNDAPSRHCEERSYEAISYSSPSLRTEGLASVLA